jgi:hypothetical protein
MLSSLTHSTPSSSVGAVLIMGRTPGNKVHTYLMTCIIKMCVTHSEALSQERGMHFFLLVPLLNGMLHGLTIFNY